MKFRGIFLHPSNLILVGVFKLLFLGITCNSRTAAKDRMVWHRRTTETKRANRIFWHQQTVKEQVNFFFYPFSLIDLENLKIDLFFFSKS